MELHCSITNMPRWITRDTVYLAWLAITCLGVAMVSWTRKTA